MRPLWPPVGAGKGDLTVPLPPTSSTHSSQACPTHTTPRPPRGRGCRDSEPGEGPSRELGAGRSCPAALGLSALVDVLACPAWCHSCLPLPCPPRSLRCGCVLWLLPWPAFLCCCCYSCLVRWSSFLASPPLPSLRVLWDFCMETEPQKNEEWVVRGPALNTGDRS